MIILDTNVLSAIIAPVPAVEVIQWLDTQKGVELCLNAITVFEARSGIEGLVDSKKRRGLERAFDYALANVFGDRVVPFDHDAAFAAAALAAKRKRTGQPQDIRDTQIAGIALSRKATLATRNIRHFSDLNVPVIDPWSA